MLAKFPHTPLVSRSGNAGNRWSLGKAFAGRFAALALVPLLVAVSGCEDARVPVFPVSGRVTFKGKPAAGAQVMLNAVNPNDIDDVAPIGLVKEDGTFSITAYDPGDGAPEGDYVVTVQWFKFVTDAGGSGAGPNVLPKEFASPATSPVKVSVRSGPTEIPPIAIK